MKKILLFIFVFFLSFPIFSQEDVKKLKKEIEKLTKIIESLNFQAKDILTEIEQIDLKILSAEKRIKYIRYKLSKIRADIKDIELRIDSLNLELKKSKKNLKKAFVLMYENGNTNLLELYFAGRDLLSVVENLNLLKIVSDRVYKQYSIYKELIKEVEREKKLLKEKEKEEERILNERKRAWTLYLNSKNEKKRKVREILKKKKNYLNLLKEKKKQLEKITHIIKKEESVEKPSIKNISELSSFKGKLIWPVRGKIVERFGIKKHPKYNIRLKSNGIEIKPYRDLEKVRSVYDGIIVFSGYVKSYGNTVIIEHPGKYYTLYSHLKDIFVEVNDLVKKGEVIGVTGNTGIREFNSLYFSIRKGITPLNPLKWLRSKKKRRKRK